MPARYFTTPIYYVNDRPHIGHLYTTVVTDAMARYSRLLGNDTRFLTGTDEHGQNIEKVARREGIAPREVADRHAPAFRDLWRRTGISNDDFIRTTEDRHRRGVEELIRRIDESGDFYVNAHEGWYCASCESFYPDKDLPDGKCPVHGIAPERQKEDNVFFRLSRYGDRLLDLYREGGGAPPFVFPESRLNEVISFVESGLKDLSVSRTSISWGIPFPGRPGHVVYVWLDALANYVTALGFGSDDDSLFRRFWPREGSEARAVHVVGKDILRFHAVYWPAFLMSAGLPVPSRVVSHGWWLKDQKKMSKSTGNVVRPDAIVDAFGFDALRWHLLAEMAFGQDASFSDEAFLVRYNADLANGLGNTLSRSLRMASDAFGGRTPSEACSDNEVRRAAEAAAALWRSAFEANRFSEACDAVRALLSQVDGYIASREPWKKVKQEGVTPALHRIHYAALEGLRIAAVLLAPIAPGTSSEVLRRLGVPAAPPAAADLEWGRLPLEASLAPASPLFPRADVKQYFGGAAPAAVPAPLEKNVNHESTAPVLAPVPAPPAPASPAAPAESGKISITDFLKVDLRIGEVTAAEKVEKSRKLMKMTVLFGDEVRTIVGGIATAYAPDQLVGRKFVFAYNLAPAKLMGIESNGMILAASLPGTGDPSLLTIDATVPSGTKVK